MSLRTRRLSKLQLNKLIAESCASPKKVSFKRKRHSSDEDEPLIFQKNKKTKSKISVKRTAARETPLVSILKQSTPILSLTKQNATKVTRTDANQRTDTEQSSLDKSPKKKHFKKCSSKKNSLKQSSPEQSSRDKSPKKKQVKKSTTQTSKVISEQSSLKKKSPHLSHKKKSPLETTPQKKNPEPLPVVPELSVTVEVKADEQPGKSINNPVPCDDLVNSSDRLGTNSTVSPCVPDAAQYHDDQNIPSAPRAPDDRVIPSVQVIPTNEDDVPTDNGDEEDFTLQYDENTQDDPVNMVNVNDAKINVGDVAEDDEYEDYLWKFLEVPFIPPNQVVTSDRLLEEPVASTSRINSVLPEPRIASPG